MKFDALREAIDELIEAGPVSDCEEMEALLRESGRLEFYLATSAGEFERWGAFALDGARTAAAWIATQGNLLRSEARRLVRRGRALDHLPAAKQAWREGEIGSAHVDGLERVRNSRTRCSHQDDEEMLVNQGRTLGPEDFGKALDYWEQLADPDGTEESAEERRNRRDVYLVKAGDLWLGKMTLDPIGGAIVANELDRLERELFEEEWKDARERLGHDPAVSDLARTPGQRRADALVEMAKRSATAPPDGLPPKPLFSVVLDWPTLSGRVCELAQGMALTPGSLIPWLDRADFERAVFEPPDRVQVSATARLFTGATRRGIQLRDRECTHPYCDRPAIDCQVDHIQPFGLDGPTTQENGRLLCGYHNRLRNQRPPPER